MEESIREKIIPFLEGGVNSEADAVYLLTQIRKVCEQRKLKPSINLKLCINWALHTNLNRDYIKEFIDVIENLISPIINGELNNAPDIFLFETFFRDELKKLLEQIEFPINLCVNNSLWDNFLKHYIGVIDECTLEHNDCQIIEKITIRKGFDNSSIPNAPICSLPFDIRWEINLREPRNNHKKISFSVQQERGRFIFSGTSLGDPVR